jgi:hypothetical protein
MASLQAAAKAHAQAVARAKAAKAAADAKRKKQNGIKAKLAGVWNSVKDDTTSLDWWKDKAVDLGISTVATVGTAACIASVACGAGLFAVGAAALFVGGLGAHMAVATDEEREKGATPFLFRTAKAEGKGIAAGILFGRGFGGAAAKGGNLWFTRWAIKGGHARIDSIVTGPRAGWLPLLWKRGGLF